MDQTHPERLLARLDAIGSSVAATGLARALIGLGSVGSETDRLDAFSDLDFFLIVADGQKARFIQNLDWLSTVCPIGYSFQNTRDGHKVLFADGIYAEFAVFELAELAAIPFAPGRIVWKTADVDAAIRQPDRPTPLPPNTEWLLGEALTCLYVGLCRLRRGERLAAQRLIQQHAVDRVLQLAPHIETEIGGADPFAPERRFERRFPQTAHQLPTFVQGYHASQESAGAILSFLAAHFTLNPAITAAIWQLLAAE